ncbi:MAG: acyltransferase family protein [Candidatus Hermodarchaeota archaeon]
MINQKLPEIDMIRIISILIVVVLIHIPLSYAYCFYVDLNQFGVFLVNNVGIYVAMGSFAFVSGFGLYLNPNNRNLNSSRKILAFLKKRFIRIFPLYWVAIILFLFFVGYLDIDPLYLLYHFLGLQIIVAPYFGPPMLTLWFIGIIVIYYLIYLVINLRESIKWIIPASIVILFFFIFLNGIFGLVEIRFFLYYLLFIFGMITALIYTSPEYARVKERLSKMRPAVSLLIPLLTTILGFIAFTLLTQFVYFFFILEYGSSNFHFILELHPDFFQLASAILLINLIIASFIIFVFSLFKVIFRGFGFIDSKRKIELVVSVTAYSTYSVYLFHRIFLTIFTAIMTFGLNINMLAAQNLYIVLVFVPFIFLFSYLIQKAYDRLWKLVSNRFRDKESSTNSSPDINEAQPSSMT